MGALENSLPSAVPTILSLTSTANDGTYKLGDIIIVTVAFTEAVTVTGTPQLTMETGSTDAVAVYTSGSGNDTLIFTYIVAACDTSSDLDYSSTTSLALNTGTIVDADSTSAYLTLPTMGAANSLGASKDLVIDGVLPTVSTVTSTTADGTYTMGDSIEITIIFNEAVIVTGIPILTLETGVTDQLIDYSSGSGGTTLTFIYTVDSDDNAIDLDYGSTGAIVLNNATIKDVAGNAATLTLASPGTEKSLGTNQALLVN